MCEHNGLFMPCDSCWQAENIDNNPGYGDYAGYSCQLCGRQRVVVCGDGEHRCEKCGYHQTFGEKQGGE